MWQGIGARPAMPPTLEIAPMWPAASPGMDLRPPPNRPRRIRHRPLLEALEDRRLLSGGPRLQVNAGGNFSSQVGAVAAFRATVKGGTAPYTYTWRFGDGSIVTRTLTPGHIYRGNASYVAKLIVRDSKGKAASDTVVVTVMNVAPRAQLAAPGYSYAGSSVVLAATA